VSAHTMVEDPMKSRKAGWQNSELRGAQMNLHTRIGSSRENNRLAVLPSPVLAKLERHFAQVSLEVGTVVYDVGEAIDHIYFPVTGIASLQAVTKDGRAIDTSIVGREGALGLMTTSLIDQKRDVWSDLPYPRSKCPPSNSGSPPLRTMRFLLSPSDARKSFYPRPKRERRTTPVCPRMCAWVPAGGIQSSSQRQHLHHTRHSFGNGGGSAHFNYGNRCKASNCWTYQLRERHDHNLDRGGLLKLSKVSG
jgi:hypothetical protein